MWLKYVQGQEQINLDTEIEIPLYELPIKTVQSVKIGVIWTVVMY